MKKILFLMVFAQSIYAQTAAEVVQLIQKNINVPWSSNTVDTFKAGNPNSPVTGIATTFMATLEVLKKAKAAGCNFVITHEPTFYGHQDDLKIHQDDPIQLQKLQYIQQNNMVVWRYHDHIHAHQPDLIYVGVAEKMGWAKYWQPSSRTYEAPAQSLETIVANLKKNSGAKTIRVVGNAKAKFSKIGLVLGAAGSGAHFRMLKNPACELLIVGETNEWETVPYVQDAITLGQNKALIVLGHADSEEAGMKSLVPWLKNILPNTPNIQFIEAGNPYWAAK
jgi:putative NIF3 family GTP cyclohydrolase 1 type 2